MSTIQTPIGSGFGAAATAAEVIAGHDLTGKTAMVTGGYSGIGLETVRTLSLAGARVVVPARDLGKAREALNGISGVEIGEMNLADPASIDAFANGFLASGRPLHILINSAAVSGIPLTYDARGYEMNFAVSHLGHFQLVKRLWPALRQAHGARVVMISAWAHSRSPVVFEDIHFRHREYDPWLAYAQSKTANILTAVAIDKRGREEGIRAFALHPGTIVETGLSRNFSVEQLKTLGVVDEHGKPIIDPSRNMKTVEQGAATGVWCAVSSQLDGMGGVYCENCDIAPLVNREIANNRPGSRALGVVPYAVDPQEAERLWNWSEQLLEGEADE